MKKLNLRMKQLVAVVVIIIGVALVVTGCNTEIPGTRLTTYSSLDGIDNYSSIDEYVGGDAYNYIIGASLVAGKIVGATVVKGIYIAVGLLIISIGLIFGACVFNPKHKTQVQAQVEAKEPNEMQQQTITDEATPIDILSAEMPGQVE